MRVDDLLLLLGARRLETDHIDRVRSGMNGHGPTVERVWVSVL